MSKVFAKTPMMVWLICKLCRNGYTQKKGKNTWILWETIIGSAQENIIFPIKNIKKQGKQKLR